MSADPTHLTDLERYCDDLLRFDNRDRYVAQSAATTDNHAAPLPPRAPALPITTRSDTR